MYTFDWLTISAPRELLIETVKSHFGTSTELQELTPTFARLTGAAPQEIAVVTHPPRLSKLYIETPGALFVEGRNIGFDLVRQLIWTADKIIPDATKVSRADVKHDALGLTTVDVWPEKYWARPEKYFSSMWEIRIFGRNSLALLHPTGTKVRLYNKHVQLSALAKRGKTQTIP